MLQFRTLVQLHLILIAGFVCFQLATADCTQFLCLDARKNVSLAVLPCKDEQAVACTQRYLDPSCHPSFCPNPDDRFGDSRSRRIIAFCLIDALKVCPAKHKPRTPEAKSKDAAYAGKIIAPDLQPGDFKSNRKREDGSSPTTQAGISNAIVAIVCPVIAIVLILTILVALYVRHVCGKRKLRQDNGMRSNVSGAEEQLIKSLT